MLSRYSFHPVLKGLILSSILAASATANANQALATSKSCMACHGVDNKLVGPSFREVAARYQGRSDATTALVEKITKGSTGAWGSIPMPPQGQLVNAAEANALATWILTLR
jgi:cytochrome c